MSRLFLLPPELLDPILAELSRGDLYRLSLTSKTAHRRAETALYANIKLDWRWSETEAVDAPLFALVFTLQRRPGLAHLVQHVTFRGDDAGRVFAVDPPDPRPTHAQTEAAMALVRRDLAPWEDVFAERLPLGNMDVWGAVLVSQLPELKTLRIEKRFAQCDVMGQVFQAAISQPPPSGTAGNLVALPAFSSLQKLAWDAMFPWHDDSLKPEILSLLCLPRVRDLALIITCPRGFRWHPEPRPCASLLTSLRLDRIREGCLGDILSATPNLQRLHWHWATEGCNMVPPPELIDLITWGDHAPPEFVDHINRDQIVLDLLRVRHTLTELVITAESANDSQCSLDSAHPVTIEGSLSGLDGMVQLKTLEAPLAFFFGMSLPTPGANWQATIPPKLEHLAFNDCLADQEGMFWNDDVCSSDIMPALESFLESAKQQSPGLARFDYIDVDQFNATKHNVDLIEEACSRVGIVGRFPIEKNRTYRTMARGAQPGPI